MEKIRGRPEYSVVIHHLITPDSPATAQIPFHMFPISSDDRNSTTHPGTWNETTKSFKNQPSFVQHAPVQCTSSNDTANRYDLWTKTVVVFQGYHLAADQLCHRLMATLSVRVVHP